MDLEFRAAEIATSPRGISTCRFEEFVSYNEKRCGTAGGIQISLVPGHVASCSRDGANGDGVYTEEVRRWVRVLAAKILQTSGQGEEYA